MRPIPGRPIRPGGLTLLCVASSVILALISQASFFEGPGGLALLLPWSVVLGLHLLVGPVALIAAWKQGPSLFKPFISLYFIAFAVVHVGLLLHGSGLDREVRNLWTRHSHPLEAGLHATLQDLEMRQAGGGTPDPERAAVAMQFVLRGADCDFRDLHAKPFLLRACALGLDELAMTMLARGADVRAVDGSGMTALHAAAAACSPDVVNELLRRGAGIDVRDAWRNTPLMLAVRAGKIDNAAALLAHAAEADAEDQNRRTPLMEAIARGDVAVAGALLRAGADANGRDLGGRSLLALAAGSPGSDIVRLLREHGAVLNTPGRGYDLPLRDALHKGRLDEADALVRIGADVNATTAEGNSLLAEVAGFSVRFSGAAGKHEIMEWLVRHGADPDGRDRNGRTALRIVSSMADEDGVRLLLHAGAKF